MYRFMDKHFLGVGHLTKVILLNTEYQLFILWPNFFNAEGIVNHYSSLFY
jgi:hypothetical protein